MKGKKVKQALELRQKAFDEMPENKKQGKKRPGSMNRKKSGYGKSRR